jgi:glutamate decarboxylase
LHELREQKVLVIAIIAIAGTTETGSIDPIYEISRIGREFGIHVHVDAAWGGPLIFSTEHRHKLDGIDMVDSITVDGHKQLYTPMGVGVLLLRSPMDSLAIRKTANYVIREESPDLGKFTLEGSRPANVLYLNASLVLLGKDGLGTLMTRSCTLVKQMATRLSEHPSRAFEVLHEPQTNLLLFRYIPSTLRETKEFSNQQTELLNLFVERIQTIQSRRNDGQAHGFTSRTTVKYKDHQTMAFRIVIANPLTQWSDIENAIQDLIQVGGKVERDLEYEKKAKMFWIYTLVIPFGLVGRTISRTL